MRRKQTIHERFGFKVVCDDTMGNAYGEIYEPIRYAIIQQFPGLIHEFTYPELILRLIFGGIIENQGQIHVGPKLREEFGVDESGSIRNEQ